MLVDAHTHIQKLDGHKKIAIGLDTLGIHPWELLVPWNEEKFNLRWEHLLKEFRDHHKAIGECGLDRVHPGLVSIDIQKRVLLRHLELAQEKKMPIVLHIVRAFSDLLELLKKSKFQQNILLHDYNGNQQEMNELLKYQTFFSYGSRIFKNEKMIKVTPIERLLLETDDQEKYSIEDIYNKAAECLHYPLKELELELEGNFVRCFG